MSQDRGISLILLAVEKWGKTTFGAFSPEPAILMAPRETGYITLLNAGRVPPVATIELKDWSHLMNLTDKIAKVDLVPYKNIVFDALTGLERLCHEHVCERDYRGDWSKKGFLNYMEGYRVSVNEWLLFLSNLDRIKARGINVILLGHTTIRTFNNPTGPDYDRYICDVHERTWGATHKWADCILFGTYDTVVEAERGSRATDKGKGIGGTNRVIYTQRRDAWDAGSRFALPERIDVPDDPSKVFEAVWQYLHKPIVEVF
ncbi:MAG TPA: ATP-binding protein [Acidobacteriota bacterium]|nr:ATP-binding protein [bacterium]HPP02929.1 ATP-binding protein [bacterium]HXK60770.1 ATP-binding protein [Acidobacteriota bacterium]